MTHLKMSFCLALVLVIALQTVTVNAACRSCSSVTYAACLNETGFAVCFDGRTQSTTHGVCPEGQVCTEKQGICMPRESEKPTCGRCNTCMGLFSCKSRTQIEFCTNNRPNGIVVDCPKGEYCSLKNFVNNQNICVKSCLDEPTCYADEEVVTPAPDPTYADICTGKTSKGIYENIYDSTCTTYVYCEELNQKMNAILYTCSSGYFNPVLQKCISEKPDRCA